MARQETVARTSNFSTSDGARPWEALTLDVERPRRPALTLEVAGRGSLVLRQNDAVLLMAQVDQDRFGVEYAVTGEFRSPMPPIRAAHAASVGTSSPSRDRPGRWAHHFAAAVLRSMRGPLHTGRWVISIEATHLRPTVGAATVAERWAHLLLPGGHGYIDWFADNGAWQILPLRQLADPDTGRVKAYRKQAREGILAPVLLWWISGLDCYVLLDGHDRIVAALSENLEPPLLALSSVSLHQTTRDTEAALSRYARTADALERQIIAGAPGAADALAAANRRLAESLKTIDIGYGATQAWPLRGGTASWTALAAAHVPTWHAKMAKGGR